MTLKTKVVEPDDDPISKIVAAKTAAILNGSKSPEMLDESGVSRKPRKGTPMKLGLTAPAMKSAPGEAAQPPARLAFSDAEPPQQPPSDGNNSPEDLSNGATKKNGNFNIGTMKIPIHKPTKESPRAALKISTSLSPSKPTEPKSTATADNIVEAVAASDATAALSRVETLRLNDKQYEIVPLGNKQWITRNEYEIMKELSGFNRGAKSPTPHKVPTFTADGPAAPEVAPSANGLLGVKRAAEAKLNECEPPLKKGFVQAPEKQPDSPHTDSSVEVGDLVVDMSAAQDACPQIQGQTVQNTDQAKDSPTDRNRITEGTTEVEAKNEGALPKSEKKPASAVVAETESAPENW